MEPKKKKKHPILQNIEQGLKEVNLAKKGKLKTTPLNYFLNKLK